jgi:hypothetical protein
VEFERKQALSELLLPTGFEEERVAGVNHLLDALPQPISPRLLTRHQGCDGNLLKMLGRNTVHCYIRFDHLFELHITH